MSALACPSCGAPFTLAAVPVNRPVLPAAPVVHAPLVTGTPWTCPIHRQSKLVPAGVSRKTGKPYSSFTACPVAGCDEGGPFGSVPSAPADDS